MLFRLQCICEGGKEFTACLYLTPLGALCAPRLSASGCQYVLRLPIETQGLRPVLYYAVLSGLYRITKTYNLKYKIRCIVFQHVRHDMTKGC